VAIGECGDAACWMVVVDDDGGRGEVGFRAVDNAQIERRKMLMLDLDVGIVSIVGMDSIPVHSVQVIPGTIPAEFEFYSRFRQNHCMNLAGPSAKFDSYGIPGIDQILPDSSRNHWRTVKTSIALGGAGGGSRTTSRRALMKGVSG